MKILTIGLNNVRRLLRERSNVFFVFVFPMLLILVIGASFGGSFEPRIGLIPAAGALGDALTDDLIDIDDVDVVLYVSRDELVDGIQRGRLNAGVVVPHDYDTTLLGGGRASVEFVTGPDQLGQQLRSTVQAAVARQSTVVLAARLLADGGFADQAESLELAQEAAATVAGVTVAVESAGEATFGDIGRFDLGAPQQLVLFVFLTSLAGSAALIQTRRWGVSRRMLATPTSAREVLLGEVLGRFGVAMVQGVFIMLGSLVVFGVDWGDPWAAAALLVAFSIVGAAGGMLLGSVLDNDEQGGSFGVFAGLGLAAIGGAMVPIEVFPETMQTVARFTPHAWAIEGFSDLIRHDGGFSDVIPELGILLLFGIGLLAVASVLFRRKLTT